MLLSLWTMIAYAQQAPPLTQFMFNNLIANPAYAGASRVTTVNFLNRSQWTGLEGAPSTLAFSAHTPVKNVGLGITFLHDRIGVHRNTTAVTNYAYHIHINEQTSFSMGLQGGVTNRRSDYQSLTSATFDPKSANSINEMVFDFGAGIYLQSARLQFGISAPSLLSNNVHVNDSVDLVFQRTNLYAYLRYRISLSKSLDLEPGVLIKYFQNVSPGIDLNAILTYKKVIGVGLAYRHKESVDALLRIQLTRQLLLAYSYDYPIGIVSRFGSSHEVMIQYQFTKKTKTFTSPR
jgi:type IX secretion system PorP/SprF family membrane protein